MALRGTTSKTRGRLGAVRVGTPLGSPPLCSFLTSCTVVPWGPRRSTPPRRAEVGDVGQAIGQVLSFGVGVALSPVPIIAVVLMLATPRGRVNGPAFLAGWVVGLAVVGTVVLLMASGGGAREAGAPPDWGGGFEVRVGGVFLGASGRPGRAPQQTG